MADSSLVSPSPSLPSSLRIAGITKFINCRLISDGKLISSEDLWVSSQTGTILGSQSNCFDQQCPPHTVVDLRGRILSPGLLDVQLNGAFGFNFSSWPEEATQSYADRLSEVNKRLISTGVTSYVPTLTSQMSELYQNVLPLLSPVQSRVAQDGAESLGAHVEGPFLNPGKNGIHDINVFRKATNFRDLEDCFGKNNLSNSSIKKITIAPECGNMMNIIPELRTRGIVCSIGHSEATYEEARNSVAAGVTMVTHLFNAMKPLHHRNPGVFGLLGASDASLRPFFGLIADGIHVHPTAINIAFKAHPDGCILVTDAMHLIGLPDAVYAWRNGGKDSRIVKVGPNLYLEGTNKIAGSSITLIECVNNFLKWTGTSVSETLKAVTATPALMLGIGTKKGFLKPGTDADLVVFSEFFTPEGFMQLVVDEVWKFGIRVYCREH